MKITDHQIEGVEKQLLRGRNGGMPMKIRRCLVIHFTSGATAASSIDYWQKNPKCVQDDIGAHIIIDRNGKVIQCRAFDRTISHAGASRWREPKSGEFFNKCNRFAIGIELANAGDDPAVQKIAAKLAGYAGVSAPLKHPTDGMKARPWEIYPAAQLQACFDVSKLLCATYNLDDITGHENVAPERKNDPGPCMPMLALREFCGFSGLPTVHWPNEQNRK